MTQLKGEDAGFRVKMLTSHPVYEVELAVASQSVTVSAGGLVTSNIASTIAVSIDSSSFRWMRASLLGTLR